MLRNSTKLFIFLIIMQLFISLAYSDDYYENDDFDYTYIYTPNGSRIIVDQHLHHYNGPYWEAVTVQCDKLFEGLLHE